MFLIFCLFHVLFRVSLSSTEACPKNLISKTYLVLTVPDVGFYSRLHLLFFTSGLVIGTFHFNCQKVNKALKKLCFKMFQKCGLNVLFVWSALCYHSKAAYLEK